MGKKKNTETKKAEPKKERKARAVMRSRKENAAGHFADRLAANMKQREDIFRAVSAYPGVNPTVDSADTVRDKLNALASQDPPFVPARKASGRKGVVFVAGQKVELSPEALALVKQLFAVVADVEAPDFFVSDGYTAAPKDTQLPIRFGSSKLEAPPVGFITKKWITAAPVAATA